MISHGPWRVHRLIWRAADVEGKQNMSPAVKFTLYSAAVGKPGTVPVFPTVNPPNSGPRVMRSTLSSWFTDGSLHGEQEAELESQFGCLQACDHSSGGRQHAPGVIMLGRKRCSCFLMVMGQDLSLRSYSAPGMRRG